MRTGLLITLALGAAGALEAADASEIIMRSAKLAEVNWAEAPHYSYTMTEAVTEGAAQATRKTYEVLMIEGSPYLRMVAEGGHELTGEAARDEERKLQREIAKREKESPHERQKRIQKYNEERDRDHAFLSEIPTAFTYHLLEDPPSTDGPVWLIEGKPKPGYTPSTREGKVLAGMNVKFWIDKATLQWRGIEAAVQQPVSIYGLIAKVDPGTKFTLGQEPVAANVWLPKHFTMQVNATALGFIKKDSTRDETYSNYRLAAPIAAQNVVGPTAGLQ